MTLRPAHLACLLLAAALVTGRAVAQEQPAEIKTVHITPLHGKIQVEGRYRRDNEERSGTMSEESDLFFKEQVELRTGGYVYHPNLFDYTAVVRLGLSQEQFELNGRTDSSDGTVIGYDLGANLLREKSISARAYASLVDEAIGRSFGRQIDLKSQTEGLELSFRGDVPITLLVEHNKQETDSELRLEDEESFLYRLEAVDQRNPDFLTKLRAEHEDVDETLLFRGVSGLGGNVTDLSETRDEFELTNRWQWGDDDKPKHSLAGRLRYQERTGFFDNTTTIAEQFLSLVHDENFSTFYRIQWNDDETASQRDRTLHGEAGFVASFYESLDVVGTASYTDQDFEDGSDRTIGGELDIDYRKKTPIGLYHCSLTAGLEFEEETTDNTTRSVRDEGVTLSGLNFSTLSQPNINAGSIVVTDSNNAIIYVQGIDYLLQPIGSFMQIARIATGGITDGETVLVDYSVQREGRSEFRTDRLHWRHRIDLKDVPVSLYAEYRLRDESLQSGDDPGNLDRRESYLFGAELRLAELTLSGEYEREWERLFPNSQSYRFRATYFRRLGDNLGMNATAHYEYTDYLNAAAFGFAPGRDFREVWGATLDVDTKLTRNLLLRLEARYQNTDGRNNNSLGRLGGSLLWQYGAIDLSLDTYYEIYTQEDVEGDTVFVGLKLTRYF